MEFTLSFQGKKKGFQQNCKVFERAFYALGQNFLKPTTESEQFFKNYFKFSSMFV
jgi:hypothetical protein